VHAVLLLLVTEWPFHFQFVMEGVDNHDPSHSNRNHAMLMQTITHLRSQVVRVLG
jgi:hypothetical protein